MENEFEYVEGNQLNDDDLKRLFPESPTLMLTRRLLETLAELPQMQALFGPFYSYDDPEQRWACYMRQDWSLRQLPAISIYEADPESKTSDNGWLTGRLRMAAIWPASIRRHEMAQIPLAFKGAMQNWFASKYPNVLLDPAPGINTETKVGGLNALGNALSWSPQTQAEIASENVPVTILDIDYRIDLRRWYDFLEEKGYSKDNPFEKTIFPWVRASGELQAQAGLEPANNVKVSIDTAIEQT